MMKHKVFVCGLVILGSVETFRGFSQLYGFMESNHSLYAMTGSFYNPGPYMGFLAMIFPVCLYAYLSLKNEWVRYFSALVGLMILCLLPAGMSRSAWIAAGIGAAYVAGMHYRHAIKTYAVRHKNRMIVMAGLGFILLTVAIYGAYQLKKDSADGRILMWKVAARAVCENPWTGYGWDYVAGAYGDAQETYFAEGDYTETEERVAGSPEYVFNEYLQVALAWGVPVLLLALLMVGGSWCVGHRNGCYGLCGALLSFGVFAFSSYPLQFPLFWLSLIMAVAGCAFSVLPSQIGGWKVFAVFVLLAVMVAGWQMYGHYRHRKEAEEKWERCRILYRSGAYEQAVESYAEHYMKMKHHAHFLFEYGHALHKLHRNEESNAILEEALKVSSDPMILNIVGKNHQEMGNYKEAEHWLMRSVHRLPRRIYPYYLLTKLYKEADCFSAEKLEWAKKMVLEKEPKVHSRAIEEMREEMNKW